MNHKRKVWSESHPLLSVAAKALCRAAAAGDFLLPRLLQAKIDLLLVGDGIVGNLADTVQKLFSNAAEATVTVSDVKQAATFLETGAFHMAFLKMASLPTAEELEAVKLIRFGKKKNTHLLFVFIIPENFEDCISGHGADIILTEPLTMEKMNFVVNYWRTYFSNTGKNESASRPGGPGLPPQMSCGEHLGNFPTDLVTGSGSLGGELGLELKAPLSDFKKSKKVSLLHSSKEKLRRERIRECCEQLRALLPYRKGRKNDAASILEAAVDHVKDVRERLPPATVRQVTEALQNNRRFCKKQQLLEQPYPTSAVETQRDAGVQTSASAPAGGSRLLAGHSGTVRELCRSLGPCAALSLSSFCAALPGRCCSKAASLCDAAATADHSFSVCLPSAMPQASKLLPQHCSACWASPVPPVSAACRSGRMTSAV
ncbi:spermatogenesis- and oogenesis-specific basic helix-loop-helix-containing protein 2 isoform X2 [Tamandua tetradactyla]|uniref:spermatogenesis- and oogenesis-specific basic helix-loop-helix-containing protein 2 isoform X2 n=1 Tax=Tamandua tetradactyla TaxID=48850 RepID=UPI004053BF4E